MNNANQGTSPKQPKSTFWRLAILVACLAVVILIGGVIFLYPPRNPEYQGKRLSTWIKEFNGWDWPKRPDVEILQHYGSSAEPLLKHMLRARDNSLETKFWLLLSRQHVIKVHVDSAGMAQTKALEICNLLNTKVIGTVPEIVALVNDYKPTRLTSMNLYQPTAVYALNTLAALGSNGAHGLAQSLTNQNAQIRERAAELLGTMPGSASDEVIAALSKVTNGPDVTLQQKASLALQLIHERRAQHIPAQVTNFVEALDPSTGPPANVWNVSRGIRILSDSGLEQGQGTWHGEDLFGSRISRTISGETGSVVFDDNRPDGFIHFIEWKTLLPVTIRSFGLIASHDDASSGFQRAFRTFRLYGRTTETDQYKLIYSENVNVPYGEGPFACMLYLFRNLQEPVSGWQFRAEFVQSGAGFWHGPRAVELYGFTAPLNRRMVLEALKNQDPGVRRAGETLFRERK